MLVEIIMEIIFCAVRRNTSTCISNMNGKKCVAPTAQKWGASLFCQHFTPDGVDLNARMYGSQR